MNFKTNFTNEATFSTWPKIQDKNLNILKVH